MRVIIQPSFGNAIAQRHWKDTLAKDIPFASEPYINALTAEQLRSLQDFHPNGAARFWGAQRQHNAKMETIERGDVVLFTGQNHVQGIGEVAASFRNAAFADLLWTPDPEKGSWLNVYSLRAFQHTQIPYTELRPLIDSDPKDVFMGLRIIRDERVHVILDGLGISTLENDHRELEQAHRIALDLTMQTGNGLIALERVNVEATAYTRTARDIEIRRTEALLVQAYQQTLPAESTASRNRCSAGVTDLYVQTGDIAELIEAKSQPSHNYVREALGQLLDYAASLSEPIDVLSALFPSEPAPADVQLLHRYGIDCLYRNTGQTFSRRPAPSVRRHVWAAGLGSDARATAMDPSR
ncbi:hypothetical protein OHB24_14585 [Kribbella sp. NBC_00482]|uniref:hypothetical protein n=1 Tax=Kribbella sp. NBC_00482 TaxID=2975968 RepID=UPI002E170398